MYREPIKVINTNEKKVDTKFKCADFGKPSKKPTSENKKDCPRLLWYALENTWVQANLARKKNTCLNPGWVKKYCHSLKLDETRILHLECKEDLISFTDKYGRPNPKKGQWYQPNLLIDWQAVSEKWSGIEINQACIDFAEQTPRKKFHWIKGWHVPSGCIWDGKAVLGMLSTEHAPKEAINKIEQKDNDAGWLWP